MPFLFGCHDKKVNRYIRTTRAEIPKMLRAFGIEFYRQVTISTPVDTGRARWGWTCRVDEPDLSSPHPAPDGWNGKASGGTPFYALDTEKALKFFTKESVTENSKIYICNAVPYIERLNNGYSKQAPARFVELAFNNVCDKLAIYAKTVK